MKIILENKEVSIAVATIVVIIVARNKIPSDMIIIKSNVSFPVIVLPPMYLINF